MKKDNNISSKLSVVLVGICSDIGLALAERWLKKGWEVSGTYLMPSDGIRSFERLGVHLVQCDMADDESIAAAAKRIREGVGRWDVLVMLPATQEPVGLFTDIDIDAWARSITVNFTSHYRMLHALLPVRRRRPGKNASVLFFAGGGTNNATVRYSAYTVAKIAQIKMCELLDAEIEDTKFVIIGPGWVKTKIHQATLIAGKKAGDNYQKTIEKLDSNELTPMRRVLECCEWIIEASRDEVGGRNFSVVSDAWGSQALSRVLRNDTNMYRLRRFGNNWSININRDDNMSENDLSSIGKIVEVLPEISKYHAPSHLLYCLMRQVVKESINEIYKSQKTSEVDMGPIGVIRFPFVQMGATSTINLFDLDELILFSFYWENRKRYKKVADIGANIGLHSICLARCGYNVRAYEPDPKHVSVINKGVKMNKLKGVKVMTGAVSAQSGSAEFIRLLGNTTGSHLAGAKLNPYGDLKQFKVKLYAILPIMKWADLIKMDIEGHELAVLSVTKKSDWQDTDMMVEIGSKENAVGVYEHMKKIGVHMFSQKIGWKRVVDLSDMPVTYKDGSLFITLRKQVPWGEISDE